MARCFCLLAVMTPLASAFLTQQPAYGPAPSSLARTSTHRAQRSVVMSHAVAEVANSGVLIAQLAGCGGLLGAGYKIMSDEGEDASEYADAEYEDKEVDVFRDTPVRYLGYANECGEAFRPLIPGWIVTFSYAIAIAYVSTDAIAKGWTCAKESKDIMAQNGKPNTCSLPATLDVLVFQMLASVVFPGFTINRWVTFVSYAQEQLHLQDQVPAAVYEYLPTAAGLALIPFIVKPLDTLVEKMLDLSLRPFLLKAFPLCELEPIFGGEREAREGKD